MKIKNYNIIKKKNIKNVYILKFKKIYLKRKLKKRNLKSKEFKILYFIFFKIKFLINYIKYIKYNLLKTKKNILIYKNIYFSYLTDGLNLKYDSLSIQNLNNKNIYILNYKKKKSFMTKNNEIDILKTQKFYSLIENIYIINDFNYKDSFFDYFFINLFLNFFFFLEFYSLLIKIILLKLFKQCF